MLFLDRVDDQVVVAGVDAHHHALVYRVAGVHEHAAALLQLPQRIGHGLPVIAGDQRTGAPVRAFALHRRVLVEHVRQHPGTAGHGHELGLEPDQPARRDAIVEAHAPAAVLRHVEHLAAPAVECRDRRALVGFLDIHRQHLERLADDAVDILEDHLRAGHRQLEAFAAHVLDQDGEVQLAPARDPEYIRLGGVFHAQRDVGEQFLVETVAYLPAGDELAFAPDQRGGVHLEIHVERGLVDLVHRQRLGLLLVGQRCADGNLVDARDLHDLARVRLVHRDPVQALETVDAGDLGHGSGAIRLHHGHFHADTDHAAAQATDDQPADVAGVIQRGHGHLQRQGGVAHREGDALQDRLKQRPHVGAAGAAGNGRCRVQARPALQGRGIHHREVELRFVRAEAVEEVERLVHDPLGARAVAVDLVHHHDGLQAQRQRFARDEARLRHRPFDRVDQQQHAVHHRQGALHLAAEVGVARGVDDVDVHAVEIHRRVLGQDRDAALFFDVVRIHHPFGDALVRLEGTGLLQQLVDERRLAMVDVGDDGDVAQRALCSAIHGAESDERGRIVSAQAPERTGFFSIRAVWRANACPVSSGARGGRGSAP